MKLGVNVAYWGLGLSAAEQLQVVQEADRLGYDSVWAAEAYGSDAATVLAWLAASTEKIKLGSAIFQIPARSPAMTAMTAATLDQISGGRLLLGLGTSGPQVAEGWHGQRFARQLQRTREYVAVVRKALARERLEFSGETLELPLPDGPGKALKLTIAPVQDRIPIYLAAIGPKNTALAGEIADGWLPIALLARARGRVARRCSRRAPRASGRSLDGFRHRPFREPDDLRRHRRAPATSCGRCSPSTWAGWARAIRTSTTRSVSRFGFADAAQRCRTSTSTGSRRRRPRRCPTSSSTCSRWPAPREHVRERVAGYRDAGVARWRSRRWPSRSTSGWTQLRQMAAIAL